jgi:hypothetical protein
MSPNKSPNRLTGAPISRERPESARVCLSTTSRPVPTSNLRVAASESQHLSQQASRSPVYARPSPGRRSAPRRPGVHARESRAPGADGYTVTFSRSCGGPSPLSESLPLRPSRPVHWDRDEPASQTVAQSRLASMNQTSGEVLHSTYYEKEEQPDNECSDPIGTAHFRVGVCRATV